MDLKLILHMLEISPVSVDMKIAIQQVKDEIKTRKLEPLQITYPLSKIDRIKEFLELAETRMVKIPVGGLLDVKVREKALIGMVQSLQSAISNVLDVLSNEYKATRLKNGN